MHFSDLFFFLAHLYFGDGEKGGGGQKGKGKKKMYIVSIKLAKKFLFWGGVGWGGEAERRSGFLLCV